MSELRAALPADIPCCARLLQDWLEATEWMPVLHSLEETEWWMEQVVFATCAVRIVGASEAKGFLALREGEILQLILAPEIRGQGLGARLVDWAASQSPGGLSLWCFQANTGARRFYAREGFTPARCTENENAEGLPDMLLIRRGADA